MARDLGSIVGKTFNQLTVLEYAGHADGGRSTMWKCRCTCGREKNIRKYLITTGRARSCGCLSVDMAVARSTKHGEASNTRATITGTKEYRTWCHMRARCSKAPKNDKAKWYTDRGITICDRWKESFNNFLADMGRAPTEKHSIDRIDFNGNYEPSNCRWATQKEQMNNTTKSKSLRVIMPR